MSTPDHSIDPRILESAKKEFLEKGYDKAALKTICENAGITTGAVYKRYKGKEDLFCAVVADTVSDFDNILEMRSNNNAEDIPDDELVRMWAMEKEDMMWWFKFINDRHDGFVLLLQCAQGTAYSNFKDEWVEKMAENTGRYLQEAQRRNLARTDISQKELHIALSAFWTTIYEPFIYGYSWEQLEKHAELMCSLFNWHKMFGFKSLVKNEQE